MPNCTRDDMFDEIRDRLDKGATKMTIIFWLGMIGIGIEILKVATIWI